MLMAITLFVIITVSMCSKKWGFKGILLSLISTLFLGYILMKFGSSHSKPISYILLGLTALELLIIMPLMKLTFNSPETPRSSFHRNTHARVNYTEQENDDTESNNDNYELDSSADESNDDSYDASSYNGENIVNHCPGQSEDLGMFSNHTGKVKRYTFNNFTLHLSKNKKYLIHKHKMRMDHLTNPHYYLVKNDEGNFIWVNFDEFHPQLY